jgi:predicted permease
MAAAIVFGFAPAWQSMRSGLSGSLGVRRDAGGPGQRLRAALIAAQVAVSLVLMMGAGLFLQTLSHLYGIDLGVAPEKLLVLETPPQRSGIVDEHALITTRELQERLRGVPGVSAVAVSQHGVLSGTDNGTNQMRPEGFVAGKEGFPRSRWDVVGPGYFGAVGAPPRFGRDFGDRDTATSPPVVIVNQTMSRVFFGTDNAVGRRLTWDGVRFLQIVGVVTDVNQHGPRSAPEPRFYLAYQQLPSIRPTWALGGTRFIIRTDRDPAALAPELRRAVLSHGMQMSVAGVTTGTELVGRTLAGERMVTWLLVGFGVLALGLACLGIYGLVAYLVVQRTAEIGLRIALGAGRTDVLWLLLRRSLFWIGAGIVLGVPLALAAARGAAALMFGVDPMDPATLAGAALAMTIMGVVAALIPSRRALNVDPLAALRVE